MIPGEYLLEAQDVEANVGRREGVLLVKNAGDRPVQVGSHYHFAEVNGALVFDRDEARGMRLNVAAGTGIRFEPGEAKQVRLVAYGGRRRVYGHQGKVKGAL